MFGSNYGGIHPDLGAPPEFTQRTSSVVAAQATPGITVTTGASNADGTAVSLISTPLTFDTELVVIRAGQNNTSATDSSTLIDILVDPAGGTTWADLILSLPAGFMIVSASIPFHRTWMFPLRIASGSTIGCRGRNATGSTRAVQVDCWVYGGSQHRPWVGTRVDAYGDTRASSIGTRVLPNATADTFGSWISIGSTTAREYGALHVSCQGDDATMAAHGHVCQFGTGSAQIGQNMVFSTAVAESASDLSPDGLIRQRIPSGTQLQMRDKASGATGDACQFIIHGIA